MTEEYLLVKVPIKDKKIQDGAQIEYQIFQDKNVASDISLNIHTTMKRAPVPVKPPSVVTAETETQTAVTAEIDTQPAELETPVETPVVEQDQSIKTLVDNFIELKKKLNIELPRKEIDNLHHTYEDAIKEAVNKGIIFNTADDLWTQKGAQTDGTDYDNVTRAETNYNTAKDKLKSLSDSAIKYITEISESTKKNYDTLNVEYEKIVELNKKIQDDKNFGVAQKIMKIVNDIIGYYTNEINNYFNYEKTIKGVEKKMEEEIKKKKEIEKKKSPMTMTKGVNYQPFEIETGVGATVTTGGNTYTRRRFKRKNYTKTRRPRRRTLRVRK